MNKAPFNINHFLQPASTEISHFLAGDNQLVVCNGVNPCYKKGLLIKDLGYSQVGDALQSGKPIRSLHHSRRTSAVKELLATVDDATSDDTQLFYSTGGAWTEIADAETAWSGNAGMDIETEDFIGYTFFVGYGTTDGFLPVRTLTGSGHTFGTTLTTDMPSAKYIKRYRDRLYVANCDISGTNYPYRICFSSVPSAGAITWTVASDFLDVDFSEEITGIEQNWDRFIIFTEFAAYMYDQSTLKKTWDIGCAGQRTIQNIGAYMVWANKDNVYASTGGRPAPIGNDILELIRKSTSTNWRSGVIDNEYHIYLGATSANGLSYTNCLATYNVDYGMWRWRELYDSVSSLAKFTDSGDDFLVIGCSDGEVMKKSKYTDTTPIYADDGLGIVSHFRTKAYDFGDPSIRKKIVQLVAYAENAQGLALSYRLFDKNQEAIQTFKPIGALTQVVNIFEKSMEGYFIQFEGREYSENKPFSFYGLTALLGADNKI
jgi:hypothetical protein